MKASFNTIIVFLCFLAFGFIPNPAVQAHPHVFVTNQLTVIFNKAGLAGIRVKWVFDDMTSAMIAGDFDRNRDGRFDKDEGAAIGEAILEVLAEQSYYCWIKIEGRPFIVEWVKNFWAELNDGSVTYQFDIPCHVKAGKTPKEFRIGVYDKSYYTDFYYPRDDPVLFEGIEGHEILEPRLARNKKEAYYGGQIYPLELIFIFHNKNS